jgi:hypothetical protein
MEGHEMKIPTAMAALQLSLVLAASVQAQNAPVELTALATMDPWKAGGYDDGSDGIAPVVYTFPAGPRHLIIFPSITGMWSCGADPLFGPDGTNASANCNGPRATGPIGTFGGFASTDFYGALVGIFLEDTLPVSLSRTLRFYAGNNSVGGIATDFKVLNPRIGEVFFVGDGLTGTGTGTVQAFIVPSTATHLYLGYIDGSNGIPQGYYNNAGELRVIVQLYQVN